MLSRAELQFLFESMEDARVERKASVSSGDVADRIRQAICAYSNDLPHSQLPGVIFIGQLDDLSCANTDISDQLLRTLSQMRDDGRILPVPSIEVERHEINNCTVAVILVYPAQNPPVRFDGRTWIRVGPRRATATADEERRLTERQLWRNLPFDARPFDGASLDDLDLNRFEREYFPAAVSGEVIVENSRSIQDKLRSLLFVSPNNVPNAAALLLYGKNPRAFIAGTYVQFLRINGSELTDPITSQKELSGPLPDIVQQLDDLLRLNVATTAEIKDGKRLEISDYPIDGLLQLARNAIMHRNYDGSNTPVRVYWFNDRIEIHSPGGLYGEVTPETIWQGTTSYRNPRIAEAMKNLGLVERFGFGLEKAKRSLRDNGNPPLEYEFVPTFTLFTVRK